MRRVKAVSIVLGLLLIAGVAGAYPRTVLLEDFASSSCPPCITGGANIHTILGNFTRDEMVLITYHMSWPSSNDPWYQANPTENNARRAYYGVNAIPDTWVDGEVSYNPAAGTGSITSRINYRLGIDSPLDIVVEPSTEGDEITADVIISADSDVSNKVLQIVLTQIFFSMDHSDGGPTDFDYSMLKMYPNASGQTISLTAGETDTVTATFTYNDDWTLPNLAVVAFVQDNTTHEVIQAGQAQIPATSPNLALAEVSFNDDDQANPNGRPDAGETVDLIVMVANAEYYLDAFSVNGVLRCDDPEIELLDTTSVWPIIPAGFESSNESDPFSLHVPDEFVSRMVTFTVFLSTSEGYEVEVSFDALVGQPSIALVNDHGNGSSYADNWTDKMLAAGQVIDVIDPTTATSGGLSNYEKVIWTTANDNNPDEILNQDERDAIAAYLDAGGRLLLTSQFAGDALDGDPWLTQYFGVEHDQNQVNYTNGMMIQGVTDGPFDGMSGAMIGEGSAQNNSSPSSMTPLENAVPFYHYLNSEAIAIAGCNGNGFLSIYAGFPLEALGTVTGRDTPEDIISGLLNWLDGESIVEPGNGSSALPTELSLEAYPNPFNPDLTVRFSLPQPGEITLDVLNMLGRHVATLQAGPAVAGVHQAVWRPEGAASGIYLLRLNTPGGTKITKALLMK